MRLLFCIEEYVFSNLAYTIGLPALKRNMQAVS